MVFFVWAGWLGSREFSGWTVAGGEEGLNKTLFLTSFHRYNGKTG
jgi:hypothetical protein